MAMERNTSAMPRRRALLGAALAAPLAATPAIAAAPHPDAAVIAACAELDRLQRQWLRLFDGPGAIEDEAEREAAGEPILDAQEPLLDRICAAECATAEGIAAKLRSLALIDQNAHDLDSAYHDERLLASVMRDAARAVRS